MLSDFPVLCRWEARREPPQIGLDVFLATKPKATERARGKSTCLSFGEGAPREGVAIHQGVALYGFIK